MQTYIQSVSNNRPTVSYVSYNAGRLMARRTTDHWRSVAVCRPKKKIYSIYTLMRILWLAYSKRKHSLAGLNGVNA